MDTKTIMIAATKSGSGKTVFTISLLNRLKDLGKRVMSYKCGPDYIDPMFHRQVIGINSMNLDLFFSTEAYVRNAFLENDADIKVIEGVMGLYDGLSGVSESASSYHLASVLNAPIILIVDAHGMGRSVVSVIEGFLLNDNNKLIKGIVLNRTNEIIYDFAKEYIESQYDVSLLGYIKNHKEDILKSRHLGLVLPDEIDEIKEIINNTTKKILENVDVEKIVSIKAPEAFNSNNSDNKIDNKLEINGKETNAALVTNKAKVRIGIARDEAFCFYYEENIKLLKDLGADVVYFSPLHDDYLREDLDGIIIGGGYPELYAKELSYNRGFMMDLRTAILGGLPTLAECGGFMYLHDRIITDKGYEYYLVGAIEGDCFYTGSLVRFGYITMTLNDNVDNLIDKAADKAVDIKSLKKAFPIKGHEFHYYDSTNNGSSIITTKASGKASYESSHLNNNQLMGFAHLYYPSNSDFAKWFVDKCYEYKRRIF